MDKRERLEKQMAFIREVDKVKSIFRQNYIADGSRRENDAEHSWHAALMAVLLNEYAGEPVDTLKVVKMLMVHDLVEIDAGDTYAYDYENQKTAHEREQKAADRIFGLLPQEQEEEFRVLWEEFEAYESAEARFAHVIDNCQPLLLNDASGGKSWRAHGVKRENIYRRNEKTPQGSPQIWEYMEQLVEENIEKGNIKP